MKDNQESDFLWGKRVSKRDLGRRRLLIASETDMVRKDMVLLQDQIGVTAGLLGDWFTWSMRGLGERGTQE